MLTISEHTHQQLPEFVLRILLIFSNPVGSHSLRLQNEEKAIREAIRRGTATHTNAPHKQNLHIVTLPACTIDDLTKHLLEHRNSYDLIHFSGHTDRINMLVQHIQRKIIDANCIQKGDMDEMESRVFRQKLESIAENFITNLENDYSRDYSRRNTNSTDKNKESKKQTNHIETTGYSSFYLALDIRSVLYILK